ncbi:hypothetical protein TorRG33x02_115590 [Trema orientale]|uniref:Uncharacterized protein n=1 Tax=Trema orientale TaxID=63057 RepID=A0A2P5F4N5_TREOI|nr:hypothetical protein TorRG33x02_115590 [Trema orientale]
MVLVELRSQVFKRGVFLGLSFLSRPSALLLLNPTDPLLLLLLFSIIVAPSARRVENEQNSRSYYFCSQTCEEGGESIGVVQPSTVTLPTFTVKEPARPIKDLNSYKNLIRQHKEGFD